MTNAENNAHAIAEKISINIINDSDEDNRQVVTTVQNPNSNVEKYILKQFVLHNKLQYIL